MHYDFFACWTGSVQVHRGRMNQNLVVGDSFGEIHLLEDKLTTFRAVALADCELLLLRRYRFQQLCREHGKTQMKEAQSHMKSVAQSASRPQLSKTAKSIVRSFSVGYADDNGNAVVSC